MSGEPQKIQRIIADAIEDSRDANLDDQRRDEIRQLLLTNREARQAYLKHNQLSQMLRAEAMPPVVSDAAIAASDSVEKVNLESRFGAKRMFAFAGIRSQPIKLQFDLGHRAGLYNGTNSPAHAAGDMYDHEGVWTQIVGDQAGAFVMADGNICPHAIRVDYGHGDGVIDWEAMPVDPSGNIYTKAVPFFDTPLCQDHGPWDFDLGLRVAGLPEGTYRVYALCRSIRRSAAAYDVSFGVNLDRQLVQPLAMPPMKDLFHTTWDEGLTYAVADVNVSNSNDWVTFITRYSRERSIHTTPHHGRSVLLGLQIVEIRDQ